MDIQLNYVEKGCGKPLILLHGNGESTDYFVYQIPYFSEKYRVIAIDTRGHGRSMRGTAPFTISQFADDLYDFMNFHKIEKAHILGFSDGGNIALLFAIRHPERVDKLILNGANLYPSGVKLKPQLSIMFEYYMTALPALWSEKTQKRRALLRLMVKEPHIPLSDLHDLSVPTLVIAGTNDMIRDSHTRLIAENIPGAALCIQPGDHFIANRCPEQFNRTVAGFLKDEDIS